MSHPVSPVELLPPHEAHPGNPQWHRLRRAGVTASEIPVILGLSTWDSPWSLWHRKRGLIPDAEAGEAAAWGRRLEPVIADAFAAENADIMVGPAGLYAHAEREWQLATPDRLIHPLCSCCAAGCGGSCSGVPGACSDCRNTQLGGPAEALLEIKHPYDWSGWGDDGTDDVPAAYLAQCLWQLDVMDLDQCWLAAYTRHTMRVYQIRRDAEGADADLEMMRAKALEFLRSDEPPPLDSHPATLAAVKAMHPDVDDTEADVAHDVATGYLQACAAFAAAKEAKRQAEAALRMAMGRSRRAVLMEASGPLPVATRSVYERKPYTVSATTIDRLTPARKDHDEQDQ